MEQLNTQKTAITNRVQKCATCSEFFKSTAVKCGQCNKYVHLKCSRMPVYMAIRHLSRVQYTCQTYMETKTDNYQTLYGWVDSLGVHVNDESRVSNVHTGELSNDGTTVEAMNPIKIQQFNDKLMGITRALVELTELVSMLTRKSMKTVMTNLTEPPRTYAKGEKKLKQDRRTSRVHRLLT